MDASYKIQRGIHVHLIQFFMCPEFWVHIKYASAFVPISGRRGHSSRAHLSIWHFSQSSPKELGVSS